MAIIDGYEPLKAAQVAALLLARSGGSMEKLKLVKLLYLCERESVRLHGHPMFGDENFSLKHGAAGTNALKGIDGELHVPIWRRYLRLDGRKAGVDDGLKDDDFDELSENDVAIIDGLAKTFANHSAPAMRKWMHDRRNVPEYEEVAEGRRPITDVALARAVGKPDPEGWAELNASMRRIARGRTRS